jgi:hypothetical protein
MRVGKDGWLELDPAQDMSAQARAAYQAMKDQYRHYQTLKAAYENIMVLEAAPQGKSLVFGYNFGKASIKIVAANEKRERTVAKPTQSLADYLAAQAGAGHSA